VSLLARCPAPDVNKSNLTTRDHSRDAAGLTYVYPVISRRAGGLSIGINLNPNNACNWRCVYCQVPGLRRGAAPAVDRALLRRELRGFLAAINGGSVYRRWSVPAMYRSLRDIALSGNGEPTSCPDFAAVVNIVGEERAATGIEEAVQTVLITNGSLIRRREIRSGLQQLQSMNGEIWFKIDAATAPDMRRMNGAVMTPARMLENLRTAATLCPTRIQTCVFARDGRPAVDGRAYLELLERIAAERIPVAGVMLYGPARPSMQGQGDRLSGLPVGYMQNLATAVERLGLPVQLAP